MDIQLDAPKKKVKSPRKKSPPKLSVKQNLLLEKKVKKEVTFDKLVELRLVRKNESVKILCRGKLDSPLKVFAHKFSATAKAAIEAAGGEAVTI